MSKKILITGGAGFIGSHLCERLLGEGYRVVSLDNFYDNYDPGVKRENIERIKNHFNSDEFKSYEGDIRDAEDVLFLFEIEKPDAVIHLAALAGVRPSLEHPELYLDVNVFGTQKLLASCVKKNIRHFIFASSSSVYGNNAKIPFSENDFTESPISPYAASKKAGELLCHTYAHLYPIKTTCLRFFTVYGPRQRPDLAIHKFSKRIIRGKDIAVFGDGATQRDYTFIDDIIDGVSKALNHNMTVMDSKYEVFNLGESRVVGLSEMITCLENVIGMKAHIKRLPLEAGDVMCTYADISKSKAVLNYAPHTDFEEGIEKFISWLRRNDLVELKAS